MNSFEVKARDFYGEVVINKALMSLAVPHGENVRIVARGQRAEEAIRDVSTILG